MPSKYFSFRDNSSNTLTIFPMIVTPLLIIALVAGLLTLYMSNFVHAAPTDNLVPVSGTVPTLVAHSKLNGPANPKQTIALSIALNLRNAGALKSYVQDTSNSKSVNYHRYLTAAQFAGTFAPSKITHGAVLRYLQASGFTITHTYTHRMLIGFRGNIGLVEQVFHVTINTYTASSGKVFYSNSTDPLLPSSLAGAVQSISGLNNTEHFHHTAILPHGRTASGKTTPNITSCLPSNLPASSYYTPGQTASAYNLNGLYNAGYHGEGQTVALFELDSFQMSDITNYENCYGHSHATIQTIVTDAGVPTDDGVLEVELDSELVLSAAPGLSQLKIYEASNDTNGYYGQWAQIIQDGTPVVSTSWGLCEAYRTSSELNTENSDFIAAEAQGQTIVAAAGDTGSSDCLNSSAPDPRLNVEDPSSQPFVTGVGGTTLAVNANGSYGGEIVWNDLSRGAGGGGISQVWSRPSWQNAPGVNNTFSNGNRETPDVSLNADPLKGYLVYCSASSVSYCQSSGPWVVVGGTSAGAPMWAAFMALTNEESVKTGGFNIGFMNTLLYQIASNPTTYASDFHDVINGNNDYQNRQNGRYPATANYDMASGLGSYNAANLAADLVNLSRSATGPRSAPASSTWYFAEGSVGGGFQEYLTLENPSTSQDATVNITYLFPSAPSRTIQHTVTHSSRGTVNVNTDLGICVTCSHLSVAAIVQVASGPNIVAERPMYFNYNGVQSGTDVVGATGPGTTYYFSKGDSRQTSSANYLTFISILNPNNTTANVTITYYTGSCGGSNPACRTETLHVGSLQRGTGTPANVGLHQQVAMSVSSDHNIVVERPMYFKDNIPNAGGFTTGAASEVGATTPGTNWLFAEGYTGTNFQEYFVLANFAANPAHANVILEYPDASTKSVPVTVNPFSQVYFNVNLVNVGHPLSSSAQITSDSPIVADRLMYFHFGPSHFSGGTEVVGTPASHSVYAFAEGYTGGAFNEFLTLQNPTNNDETVVVTLFGGNVVFQQQVVVVKHSRRTININTVLNPIAQGAVSLTVQAMSGTIVAERPMYFGYGSDNGGTDVIGYTGS